MHWTDENHHSINVGISEIYEGKIHISAGCGPIGGCANISRDQARELRDYLAEILEDDYG
jgi:hypothetical protein